MTQNHSRHPRAMRSKPKLRLLCSYVHAMIAQTYWSLRLRYWLFRLLWVLRLLPSLPKFWRNGPHTAFPFTSSATKE